VETDANYRMGSRVLAELIGGIGGGALLGWVVDHFVGTSPWGLLVMMALGIVVAFRNIIRMSGQRLD
jgi:ATP synthase protein I